MHFDLFAKRNLSLEAFLRQPPPPAPAAGPPAQSAIPPTSPAPEAAALGPAANEAAFRDKRPAVPELE
jgi:hypothetical protein